MAEYVFKVGDRAIVSGGGCSCDGRIVTVTAVDSRNAVYYEDGEGDGCCSGDGRQQTDHVLTLVESVKSKEGIVMSVINRVRDLTLSKADKLRRKYNIVDTCGNRTSDGTDLLLDLLFAENLEKLIDPKLTQLDAEDQAEKKK